MYKRYIKLGVILLFALMFTYLAVELDIFQKEKVLKLIAEGRANAYFKVYFIVITTVLLIFFVPLSWLSLAATIFFGLEGCILISLAGLFSGIISFGIARLFKEDVSQLVEKLYYKKERKITLEEIYSKVKKYGFGYVFFIRSMPFIPFNIGNYIFGVSFVSFKVFILATWLAVAIGQSINIYFFYKALNIGESSLYTIVAAILKGIYFLAILLWQKKSRYIAKE